MNTRTDSRKIGLIAAAATIAVLFAMPTMMASAATAAKPKPAPVLLGYEIGCQWTPCGTTAIYIEPYVSAFDPSWIFTDSSGINTGMFGGVTTTFVPLSTTAKWIADPYPGDFGINPHKTIQVSMLGLVEVYAPNGFFLSSFSARVTFDCQNLNGQVMFLNTHPDVWGTTSSGTLTDVFSALTSCVAT